MSEPLPAGYRWKVTKDLEDGDREHVGWLKLQRRHRGIFWVTEERRTFHLVDDYIDKTIEELKERMWEDHLWTKGQRDTARNQLARLKKSHK